MVYGIYRLLFFLFGELRSLSGAFEEGYCGCSRVFLAFENIPGPSKGCLLVGFMYLKASKKHPNRRVLVDIYKCLLNELNLFFVVGFSQQKQKEEAQESREVRG